MKQRPKWAADDPRFVSKLDDQIERLRRMLVLMAPETGAVALGAALSAAPRAAHAPEALPAITK